MSILRLRSAVRFCRPPSRRTFSCTRPDFEGDSDTVKASGATEPLSSCAPNTVLEGLAYLKDQPPVLALPDEEYPPWLWDLLKPQVLPDDGPGGKAEKIRLRKENRQRIQDQNFMKTQ